MRRLTIIATFALAMIAACASDRVELFPDGTDAATPPPGMDATHDAEVIDSGIHADAAADDAAQRDAVAEDARAPDATADDAEVQDSGRACVCRYVGCIDLLECQNAISPTSTCERGTCTESNGTCSASIPCAIPRTMCTIDERSIDPCP